MNSTLRKLFVSALATVLLMTASSTEAQEAKVYRIGVITAGGAWYEVIDGLRAGLKQLGLEERKHFTLAIRDTKGNAKAAEEAAKNLDLEQDKVNLIYTTQTSVSIAAKRATGRNPHRVPCWGRTRSTRARRELGKTWRKIHGRL